MSLLKLFRRGTVDVGLMGPLFPTVRDAMKDVQAYARSHGGDIELLEVNEEGDVKVRFRGACMNCPMSGLTLKTGIEERLRELVPGVRNIVLS